MLFPAFCNAGILSSEWGITPSTLMTTTTKKLDDKSINCIKNCAITAYHTIFSKKMNAKFWFTTNDKHNARLKEVWLDSEKLKIMTH